jgi:3-hydroxyacyl-CoA dehydrogenase
VRTDSRTSAAVTVTRHRDVLVLTIDNPPVNASSGAVRRGIVDVLSTVDLTVAGVVLVGAGGTFVAGSDLREFGGPVPRPWLPEVIAAIEACPVPVTAALDGHALGGGLELALGADLRVATRQARMGLPEVTLGMVPGAGGTQRLPRLVGRSHAMDLIVTGRRLGAEEGLAIGLVDRVVDRDDLLDAAIASTRDAGKRILIATTPPEEPETDLAAAETEALRRGAGRPQAVEAIRLVRRATEQPATDALADERRTFDRLRQGDEAAALRHLFFAERTAARLNSAEPAPARLNSAEPASARLDSAEPAAADPGRAVVAEAARDRASGAGRVSPPANVGIVGAGKMGLGIAVAFAAAGTPVTLVEADTAVAEAAAGRIGDEVARQRTRLARRGVPVLESVQPRIAADMSAVAGCDLVIEAVYEDLQVKRAVLTDIAATVDSGCLIATNTSYLDLADLSAAVPSPDRFLGLHFFHPAQVMSLVEVVAVGRTADRTVAAALRTVRGLGKQPVLAGAGEGFLGNRVFAAYRRQAEYLLEDGTLPGEVDAALRAFGFAMGPFAVADMSGLQIAWAMRRTQRERGSEPHRYVDIPDRLCEQGRFGRSTGAGYYRYGPDGRPSDDPEVTALIVAESARKDIRRRPIFADEIVARTVSAMVVAAHDAVADGAARRPGDIDVAMTHGFGFPRHLGGPLWWAARLDPAVLAEHLRRVEASDGVPVEVASITAMLDRLRESGG